MLTKAAENPPPSSVTEARAMERVRMLEQQEGFTVVELVTALTIFAVGAVALVSAMGSGSRLLVQGKQRQVASEEASARIERARNVPYAEVALDMQPTHSTDPDSPDHHVDATGTSYDLDRDGTADETLLVDTTSGQVPHVEGPFQSGSTDLTVYQYVTWVDDAGVRGTQDYKRVSVVVVYRATGPGGRAHSVEASAFVTEGTVTVGGQTLTPSAGSTASPSPTPSAGPTPSSCSGDTTAPTGGFTILAGTGAGDGFSSSTTVTLSLSPSDACTPITVALSNDNTTYAAAFTYSSSTPTVGWTIPSGDGLKRVWARFADGAGNQVTVGPESITLDATPPTRPGILVRSSLGCQGTDRTVGLSWDVATDTNLLGYRVYRNVNGAGSDLSRLDMDTFIDGTPRRITYTAAGTTLTRAVDGAAPVTVLSGLRSVSLFTYLPTTEDVTDVRIEIDVRPRYFGTDAGSVRMSSAVDLRNIEEVP